MANLVYATAKQRELWLQMKQHMEAIKGIMQEIAATTGGAVFIAKCMASCMQDWKGGGGTDVRIRSHTIAADQHPAESASGEWSGTWAATGEFNMKST